MSTNGSPPDMAVAELSISFQDELTATIHNAFGVAVEIAVVEITKLVGHVLRDVRDQMDEALRDNKSLKFRLQEAEHELDVARGRQVDEQQATNEVNTRVEQVHQQLNCLDDLQDTIAEKPRPFHDQENIQTNGFGLEPEVKVDAQLSESFCEIREDGSVFTHDIKAEMESSSNQVVDFGSEEDRHIPADNQDDKPSSHLTMRHACLETAKRHDPVRIAPGIHPDVDPQIEVKVELADHGCNSTLNTHSGEQDEYSAERLSIAQSRLLEDWRPEPLQLLYNDPDSFVPSTSHSLSDSPNFNPDIPPDLDILSASGAGLSVGFAKPYPPPRGPAAASNSHQSHSDDTHKINNMATHTCKICGEKFHRSEELSQHRSLVHPKDLNKNPKRNVFAPGRSPFHCSLCGRDFNRMEHLKIHQRRHTGERPYGCTVCSARFRHSWALTRHFRIHTGEKPYVCSQCGKTFRNCGGLRFHQRSHSMGGVV